MNIRTILLALTAFVVGCSSSKETSQNTISTDTGELLAFQDEITVSYLRNHLMAFAHDSMEGRETGEPGQKMAAKYLADQYREMGLKPVGDNNTYLQKFDLGASRSDSILFETYRITDSGRETVSQSVASSSSTADYVRAFGGADTIDTEIVFAGFGVNDPSRGVAHLEGASLKGKWVMVFQEIPHVIEGDTIISTDIGNRNRFGAVLSQKEAAGLLVISQDPSEFDQSARRAMQGFGEVSGMQLKYRMNSSGGTSPGYNIVGPKMAASILGLEQVSGLENLRNSIIENIDSFRAKQTGYGLNYIPYVAEVTIETENVVALLEGADPELKDEVVVLTSHYDHVGIGQPDSTGDRIYNGADDDGSGTMGVLNTAKAFVEARENGVAPRRSILFLNVTGEEKGLLGSRYYSDHPIFPVEKTVANLNTDMIGRIDEEHEKEGIKEYVYIIGSEIISSDMDSLMKAANRRTGQVELDKKYNDLNDPNQFYRRSDHWNFGRLGIPFSFFFTGVHEDYHRPSDEPHKIEYEKMSKIVRTMFGTAVMIANTDNPPEVDNQAFIERTQQ